MIFPRIRDALRVRQLLRPAMAILENNVETETPGQAAGKSHKSSGNRELRADRNMMVIPGLQVYLFVVFRIADEPMVI